MVCAPDSVVWEMADDGGMLMVIVHFFLQRLVFYFLKWWCIGCRFCSYDSYRTLFLLGWWCFYFFCWSSVLMFPSIIEGYFFCRLWKLQEQAWKNIKWRVCFSIMSICMVAADIARIHASALPVKIGVSIA